MKIKKLLLTAIQLLPPLFSLILLVAHFLRSGNMVLVIILLLFPIILIIRKPVTARLVQIILVLASVEWIKTTVLTIIFRDHIEEPWGRYLIIMGTVSLFTFLSAFVFFLNNLKVRYYLNKQPSAQVQINNELSEL
jgi:hypothetical protein